MLLHARTSSAFLLGAGAFGENLDLRLLLGTEQDAPTPGSSEGWETALPAQTLALPSAQCIRNELWYLQWELQTAAWLLRGWRLYLFSKKMYSEERL